MTVRAFGGTIPTIHTSAFIDETALVIGNVRISDDSSVWPMAVVDELVLR